MSVERKGEQIIIHTEKGAQSISPMKTVINSFDAGAFKAWQDECTSKITPNVRLASELTGYLMARYDLEPLDLRDDTIQMFLHSFVPRHFGERLKHNPPQFSFNMTDKELENWQRETDSQREEIRLTLPEQFGIKVHGFHILHTNKNEPLIEVDRRQWWERWGNEHCKDTTNYTEPEGYFCFEETACEGSGSGFGGTALAREAALFIGVTEEDIKNRTNRFLGYASALVEKGLLPPITDFMNK